MALFSTEALVLRGHKLGETSRIVVLLTRERGKLRAVARGARGARPRYRSALEPLSEVRVSLYGRQGAELLRLGEAELLHSAFRAGSRSLDAALFLSGCAELLDAFSPEGEAEDKVYRLALAVVRATEAGASPALLGRYLEAWLLKLQGLYPSLDRCAACGRLAPGRDAPLPPCGARLRVRRLPAGVRPRAAGRGACAAPARVLEAARGARTGDAGPAAQALEAFHRDADRRPPRARAAGAAGDPRRGAGARPMTLQELVFELERFWSERGCAHPAALGRRGRRRHDAPRDLLPRARARSRGASATCSRRGGPPTGATARTRTGSTSTSSSR